MGADPRTESVAAALATLRNRLEVVEEPGAPASHVVVGVTNAEEPECVTALGAYLTGLVANVVRVDLLLADVLLGGGEDADAQLLEDVERLMGATNTLDDSNDPAPGTITSDFRDDYRNSWILEGIAHAVVSLPEGVGGPCIPGVLHALTLPHHKSSMQGLDAVALFDDDDECLAISVGEAKASSHNATNHLADAVGLFTNIDGGLREHEIRSVVNMLSGYLTPAVATRLTRSFWRDRRMYLPVVGYSGDAAFTPAQNRPATFGALAVPRERRRLVIVPLQDFHGFFDRVADAMRDAVVL